MSVHSLSLHTIPVDAFEHIYLFIGEKDIKTHAALSVTCTVLMQKMDEDERIKLHMKAMFPLEYALDLKDGVPVGEWKFSYRLQGRTNKIDATCLKIEMVQEEQSKRLDAEIIDREMTIGLNTGLMYTGTALTAVGAIVGAFIRR